MSKIKNLKQKINHKDIDPRLAKILCDEIVNSLFYFNKLMLEYKDLEEDVHLELCEFVDDRYLEPGQDKKPFKLILLPRGSFKSSIITIGHTIQSIVKNPNIRILIANEKLDNAKAFLSEIKGHFENNEKFRNFYGDWVSKFGWREDSIFVSRRTKNLKEPTVSTAGVEVVKVGMHYELIIMDDLVSDINTSTLEQRNKVKDFYRLALSLLEPGGTIICVGTRWRFDDLYNHLIENEKHRFNYYIRGAYKKDKTLWFPQRLTENFLQDQRKSQSSYQFACQYLNNPIDDEEAKFKKEWIKNYSISLGGKLVAQGNEKAKHFRINDCRIFMHIDPATSDKNRGDFTAFIVSAISPEDFIYILEANREKLNLTQLINRIFDYYKKYPNVRKILIEMQATQQMIKFPLFEEQKKRRIYLPIEEITHTWVKSKENRISGLIPRFEFGTIFIKSDMVELEDELLRFPVGQHDDLIDALSFGLNYWKKPSQAYREELPKNCFKSIMLKKANKGKDMFKTYIDKPISAWR